MNQARSPFAQAVLERNFPEDQISSTGVDAIEGTSILPAVLETAKNWGVPISQTSSRSLRSASNDLLTADLVIVAENSYGNSIRNLGYRGAVHSYEEIFEDKDFIPQDPGGLAPDAIVRELGKVGALTLRAAIDVKGYPHAHKIHVVIPHGVSDLGMALANAQMARITEGAILIDADLRAPLGDEIEELGLERVLYDIDALSTYPIPEISSGQILTHSRQINFPEKYFLSPVWREWIQELANRSPIVIVTAPRHSQLRRLADSYLSSFMADEFTVISA